MQEHYDLFIRRKKEIADINNIIALANWDLEVNIPEKSWESRWNQIQTLSGIAYDLSTNKDLWNLLEFLINDKTLNENQLINVQLSKKDFDKIKKYPKQFILELSKLQNDSFIAWQEAKKTNDFSKFEPFLEKIVEMKRKEASILWYKKNNWNLYDFLLEEFEPWMTCEKLDLIFESVKKELVPFIKNILNQNKKIIDIEEIKFSNDKLKFEFSKKLSEEIGFDFSKGRLDLSSHPFTTSFSPSDVRITTKLSESWILNTILSTIHESWHGIYEQNLLESEYWMPLWQACSYWIHESQSLIWERNIAKSLWYWKRVYPLLKKEFKEQLKDISLEEFYESLNKVENTLIRTEADELTYHIHILIRYEIEKSLLNGDLKVKDLPKVWNSKYKDYLEVDIKEDSKGCLQDVHWSHGYFGYFPSYSLGSFYAAQFFSTAKKQIGNFQEGIEQGNFLNFKNWLNKNIQIHWRKYNSEELCKNVTGEILNFKYFFDYVKEKYWEIYNKK